MVLDSLPSRPITYEELYRYHSSNQFIEVTPVNLVIDEEGNGQTFPLDAVFVTDDKILAIQYDINDHGWKCVFQDTNDPHSKKGSDGVVREKVAKARRKLEDTVEILQSEGIAGDILEVEDIGEGRAVSREADKLTQRIKQQYIESISKNNSTK